MVTERNHSAKFGLFHNICISQHQNFGVVNELMYSKLFKHQIRRDDSKKQKNLFFKP